MHQSSTSEYSPGQSWDVIYVVSKWIFPTYMFFYLLHSEKTYICFLENPRDQLAKA